MILAGDVGGTHTRLALMADGGEEPRHLEVYRSSDHSSLEEMLSQFVAAYPAELEAATLGVAGPVRDGRTQTINLAWPVDAAALSKVLGLDGDRVSVINDLEANAWGLEALKAGDLTPLNTADPEPGGTVALIAAGTGLGEAFVTHGPHGPVAQASPSPDQNVLGAIATQQLTEGATPTLSPETLTPLDNPQGPPPPAATPRPIVPPASTPKPTSVPTAAPTPIPSPSDAPTPIPSASDAPTPTPEPTASPAPPQCSNGVDDDGDGSTDYPDDLQCTDASDDDEFA